MNPGWVYLYNSFKANWTQDRFGRTSLAVLCYKLRQVVRYSCSKQSLLQDFARE